MGIHTRPHRGKSTRALLSGAALVALIVAGACNFGSVSLGNDEPPPPPPRVVCPDSGSSSTGSGMGAPLACPAPGIDGLYLANKPCDVPFDQPCITHEDKTGWMECVCGCYHVGQWACQGASGLGICPDDMPQDQASCAGSEKSVCMYYPTSRCYCDPATHAWSCDPDYTPPWTCNSPQVAGSDPDGIDPCKRVADLTDAEAHAWCAWVLTVDDWTDSWAPDDRPISPDGTVSEYAAKYGKPPPLLCLQRLSINHCVMNLKLHACQATVQQLDDCVHTINDGKVVGGGCDVFRAQPECDHTVVVVSDDTGDPHDCRTPVQ